MTAFFILLAVVATVITVDGFKIPSTSYRPRSNLALDGSPRDNVLKVLLTTSVGMASFLSPLSVSAEDIAATVKASDFKGFISAMENRELTKVVRNL